MIEREEGDLIDLCLGDMGGDDKGDNTCEETSASSRLSRMLRSLNRDGESMGDGCNDDLAVLFCDLFFILEGLITFSCVM